MRTPVRLRRSLAALALAPVLAGLAACGGVSNATSRASSSAGSSPAATLHLGYFANVTHAAALVAVGEGFLAKDLGATKLTTQTFNAGPAAIEALNAGSVDAAYVGPSPAINDYVKSHGDALRIVSGAASGGAQLVVRPDITTPAQLKGQKIASPQLGGTQDVALRSWLSSQGFTVSLHGAGDVTINSTDNAQTLALFTAGKLDGAWLPEPWASRLVVEAGAKVLVDEKSLWPKGQWVTNNIVVSRSFLDKHPQTVTALLTANVESVAWINANQAAAKTVVNDQIARVTGKPLKPAVLDRAFGNLTVTVDPLASTLQQQLDHAVAAKLTKKASLDGIYDLTLLNRVLKTDGTPAVTSSGLGKE